jgi:hypothetical protein
MAFLESKTIRDMAPYDFWAAPYAIGLCPDDVEAVKNGTAGPELQMRAHMLAQVAQTALINAEAGQPFGKPS